MAHMLFKKKFEGLQKDDNNQSQVGEVSLKFHFRLTITLPFCLTLGALN